MNKGMKEENNKGNSNLVTCLFVALFLVLLGGCLVLSRISDSVIRLMTKLSISEEAGSWILLIFLVLLFLSSVIAGIYSLVRVVRKYVHNEGMSYFSTLTGEDYNFKKCYLNYKKICRVKKKKNVKPDVIKFSTWKSNLGKDDNNNKLNLTDDTLHYLKETRRKAESEIKLLKDSILPIELCVIKVFGDLIESEPAPVKGVSIIFVTVFVYLFIALLSSEDKKIIYFIDDLEEALDINSSKKKNDD